MSFDKYYSVLGVEATEDLQTFHIIKLYTAVQKHTTGHCSSKKDLYALAYNCA